MVDDAEVEVRMRAFVEKLNERFALYGSDKRFSYHDDLCVEAKRVMLYTGKTLDETIEMLLRIFLDGIDKEMQQIIGSSSKN
jgi:hypothetical protein